MGIVDIIFTPFYLSILLVILGYIKRNYIFEVYIKEKLLIIFSTKVFGALFIAFIYEFAFGGGQWDTFNFHDIGTMIIYTFNENIEDFFKLLMLDAGDYSNKELMHYISGLYSWYFKEDSAFFIGKMSGVIGLFTFNSYTSIAITFSLISFIGNLAFYKTLIKIFPRYKKELFVPTFIIPSVIAWGSGLFKDTITFGALGILIFSVYQLAIERKNIIKNIIGLTICGILVYRVKDYILIAFLPATLILLIQNYKLKIKSNFLRIIITPIIIIGSIIILTSYIDTQKKYIESTINTVSNMQEWHYKVSSKQTSYSLGEYDQSITGILSKIIPATNVALFRPYIWEADGFLMTFASLESHVIFFIFLHLLLTVKIKNIFKIINENPVIAFMIAFSLILAFIVGFTTYNFGSLVRYKIPILPPFLCSIQLIKVEAKRLKEKPLLKDYI